VCQKNFPVHEAKGTGAVGLQNTFFFQEKYWVSLIYSDTNFNLILKKLLIGGGKSE